VPAHADDHEQQRRNASLPHTATCVSLPTSPAHASQPRTAVVQLNPLVGTRSAVLRQCLDGRPAAMSLRRA
jgi:hypothetical protein